MAKLDAVVPLVAKDLKRFEILARSLQMYMHDLGQLWVVVPAHELVHLRQQLSSVARKLPLQLVPETLWIPEMSRFRYLKGWYRQQLVKLAASEFVETDFYLTLDADVICTRACSYDRLVLNGKAPCFVFANRDHLDWYDGAERVLGLSTGRRGELHNVTPCVLARSGVRELLHYLDQRARQRTWTAGIRGWQQRLLYSHYHRAALSTQSPWRAWLAASTPWAEYALYYTFLEATDRFAEYHTYSDRCVYDVERSIWSRPESVETWDPRPLFLGQGPPYFAVVQSNTRLDPRLISDKLAHYNLVR